MISSGLAISAARVDSRAATRICWNCRLATRTAFDRVDMKCSPPAIPIMARM
ncbi:hypothetical protein D3C86_1930190 [compost metagenome]